MCTVTFVPVKDGYFLTSNRDMNVSRAKAIPPALYEFDSSTLIFPRDIESDATWIALNVNRMLACC